MAELRHPDGPRVFAEVEKLSPENRAGVAPLHARAGKKRDVARLVASLGDDLDRSDRLFLVTALELVGDAEKSDGLAAAAPPDEQADLLAARADAALDAGANARGLALARAWADSLDDDASHEAFLAAASRLMRAGDPKGGRTAAARAEKQWSRENASDQFAGEQLASIAETYAEVDATKEALRVARAAEQRSGASEGKRKPYYGARWMPVLVRVHELAGDPEHARFLAEQHAVRIAVVYADVGAMKDARRLALDLDEAMFEKVAPRGSAPYEDIAIVLHRTGDSKAAHEVASQHVASERIQRSPHVAARLWAHLGETARAHDVLDPLDRAADKGKLPGLTTHAALARIHLVLGDVGAALRRAASEPRADQRVDVLRDVAAYAAEHGMASSRAIDKTLASITARRR